MSRMVRAQAKAEKYQLRMENAGNQLHSLYILETVSPVTQDSDFLPVVPEERPTLVSPAPRVRLGAKLVPGPGGAMELVGDAEVKFLTRGDWPQGRLLAARGFRIDDDSAAGTLYQLMAGTLKECGPSTWQFLLTRVMQLRDPAANP
jgi:hypothetical protein